MEPSEVADAVRRAANGDKSAWEALVEGFGRMIWGVAVGHRLAPADVSEVMQTTWLRLLEHLDRIEQPERLGGWLATTARNEPLRMLRVRARELPVTDEESWVEWVRSSAPSPEAVVLDRERDRGLRAAYSRLDKRCQEHLWFTVVSDLPYTEIAKALQMPVGSIGPTRARCLDRLHRLLDAV